ncbi:MAG: recombinase family protein, partial [Ruminiclostridium sp.]
EVLKIIRFLRERGINMHFENENLDSINVDKEFEITLRGMLAQDESRNISENIQWGFQRKFEKGDIFTKYKNFMGYDCVDGEIVIVPDQAEVVRKMFGLYLQGLSLGQIKSYLESQGIKTVTGKENWDTKTIQKMLKNEKYKGDTMLQKTFTEDFMTGKKNKNIGQRNRYYVKDSHPAIVSAEVFDEVQEEMAKRSRTVIKEDGTVEVSASKYNGKYLLGNLLVCGDCGASYRRRTERGKVVWRCTTRIENGKEACPNSPTLDEERVKAILGQTICEDEIYDENIIRNKVDRIQIFYKYIIVCSKDGLQFSLYIG